MDNKIVPLFPNKPMTYILPAEPADLMGGDRWVAMDMSGDMKIFSTFDGWIQHTCNTATFMVCYFPCKNWRKSEWAFAAADWQMKAKSALNIKPV